jgi:hypothetical protein
MPKGHTDQAKVGLGEYEHPGSSVDVLRTSFLIQIQRDMPHVLEALRELDGSEAALLAWAEHWHLQDAWILDVARRTLETWHDYPALAKHRQWASVIRAGAAVPEPAAIRWEPTQETAAEFLHRVTDVYMPDVRRWATSIGLVNTPQKPKRLRDMGALAQYHVKGDDLDAVADESFGGDDKEDTARKALTHLADLIGLTLRK